MAEKTTGYVEIPKEKFAFVQRNDKIFDRKFDDKPIGYFKDAWIRFRKSRAAVVAAVIILLIVVYAFVTPFLIDHDKTFMVATYAKKAPRVAALREYGICDGGQNRSFSENGLIKAVAIGVAAENWDGSGVSIAQGLESVYQPMLRVNEPYAVLNAKKQEVLYYDGRIDTYLEVGFIYRSIEQQEYENIRAWEEETGLHVLYPLIADNEWNVDPQDANCWYKSNRNTPVTVGENGKAKTLTYDPDMILEDNYERDADGNPVYFKYTGGGTFETAQYRVRVLYYNYYRYLYGAEPDYIFGTDSSGYDLAVRMAGGIKLSLLVAICVSVINFLIGAVYGAIEGYYGGAVDLTLERISDVLSGVPFIVVATLFQLHLAAKLGPVPCLLFAYVVTGWIGTASSVRTQFYRFKNQEYVMAARTLGARDRRIIWKHIFPNSLGTIITSSALVIPGVIGSESMLSYLGIVKLGSAEVTSLGTLLSDASGIWTNYPHLMIFPAIILSLLMICFNLFGNGLRDAFNPALRGVEE